MCTLKLETGLNTRSDTSTRDLTKIADPVTRFHLRLTTEGPYTLQLAAHLPLKIARSHGGSGPHLIHGSLGPPESTTQTASRSVQPCSQGWLVWQTNQQSMVLRL